MVGFLPEQGASTPPWFATIIPVKTGIDWLSEAAATGCGARGIPPDTLEVAVAGCGARDMLPGNSEAGAKGVVPTVGVVPGVGVDAELVVILNKDCIHSPEADGVTPVAADTLVGASCLEVPIE